MALGVAVGVAGMHAMKLGTDGAVGAARQVYVDAAGGAALSLLPAGDPTRALPEGVVAAARLNPEVREVKPVFQAPALRLEEVGQWMGVLLPQGEAGLLLIGVDEAEWASPRWRLVAGGAGASGAGVLVGAAWAESRGLQPGGRLNLVVGGKAVSWGIDGLVAREGLGAEGFGRVILAPAALAWSAVGAAPDTWSEAAVGLQEGADPVAVAARLEAALGPGVVAVPPASRGVEVAARLANLTAGTDLLRSIGLFLAAFLIYGQFATRAAERARVFGLLRCAGATRAQAAAVLLGEAAALAVPGALLGAALGPPLAAGVAATFAEVAQADLRVPGADPAGALQAAGLGVLVALLTVSLPAWRAGAAPVLSALRARGRVARAPSMGVAAVSGLALALLALSLWRDPPSDTARVWTFVRALGLLAAATAALPSLIAPLARLGWRGLARVAGPAVGLGLASLRWRPVRSGLAAGAVLSAVALVGGVAALGLGLRAEMADWTDRALGWDLYVSRPAGFSAEDQATIRQMPGVARLATATIRPVMARVPGREAPLALSVVGLDAAAYAEEDLLRFAEGTAQPAARLLDELAGGQTAFVTGVVAAQAGLHPGDTVVIPGRAGPVTLRISAEVVDYTQNGFALVVGARFVEEALGARAADVALLRLAPDARLEALEPALRALPGVVVERREALVGRVMALVDQSMAAMDLLLWLAAVVGLLAVGSALAQGAVERQGDLANLSALGMTRRAALQMIATEGVLTAGVGALGGVALGWVLAGVFASATHTLGIPIPTVTPWRALLGSAVAAVLASGLAAWLPARRALARGTLAALRAE